jgi:uncharacterized protein (TIGR02246 family)
MRPSTFAGDVRLLFDRYEATFATRDVDAIVALHAPDSQFWLHLDREPARGRAAIAATFAAFFAEWPEFGFVVHRVLTGPDHWVLDWALTAELARPDGRAVTVRFDCLDIVTVDPDGLVARKDTFVDDVQATKAVAAAAA